MVGAAGARGSPEQEALASERHDPLVAAASRYSPRTGPLNGFSLLKADSRSSTMTFCRVERKLLPKGFVPIQHWERKSLPALAADGSLNQVCSLLFALPERDRVQRRR
jgi:hypothetical protein